MYNFAKILLSKKPLRFLASVISDIDSRVTKIEKSKPEGPVEVTPVKERSTERLLFLGGVRGSSGYFSVVEDYEGQTFKEMTRMFGGFNPGNPSLNHGTFNRFMIQKLESLDETIYKPTTGEEILLKTPMEGGYGHDYYQMKPEDYVFYEENGILPDVFLGKSFVLINAKQGDT